MLLVIAALTASGSCRNAPRDAPAEPLDAARSEPMSHGPQGFDSSAAAPAKHAWRGLYKSVVAAPYIPPDWKGVRWSVKDTPAGLGEGVVAFRVDDETGRVLGTIDGPLGPAAVEGFAHDRKLSATIRRKDPTDLGFTGTLVGAVDGDRVEGTMSVALAAADAVRAVSFTATPDGAAR